MIGYLNLKALYYLVKVAISIEFITKQLNYLIYKYCKLINTKE
jgi:hypothetical protein